MGKLNGILSLAFSRKFLLAVFVLALIAINKKFALGFTDAEVAAGAAAIVACIIGIAHEDASKDKNPTGTPAAIALVFLLPFLGGCNLAPHVEDPLTIAHVDDTIKSREKDFGRLIAEVKGNRDAALAAKQYAEALKALIPTGTASIEPPAVAVTSDGFLKGIQILQDAEMDRLKHWRNYEASKMPKVNQ